MIRFFYRKLKTVFGRLLVLVSILTAIASNLAHGDSVGTGCNYSPNPMEDLGKVDEPVIVNGRIVSITDKDKLDSRLANLGGTLLMSLESHISTRMSEELNKLSEHFKHSINISRPVQISIAGSSGIKAKTDIEFEKIDIEFSFKKTKKILFLVLDSNCEIQMQANRPVLTGEYDFSNENLLFRSMDLKVQHSQKCLSPLGRIPFLGSYIERRIEDEISGIVSRAVLTLSQSMSHRLSSNNNLGPEEIPDCKSVFQRLDLGIN